MGRLRLQFAQLNLTEEEELTRVLYSRADSWLGWAERRDRDRPLRSLFLIARLSVKGTATMFRNLVRAAAPPRAEPERDKPTLAKKAAAGVAALLVAALFFTPATESSTVAAVARNRPADGESHSSADVGAFHVIRDLASLSRDQDLVFRGTQAKYTLNFSVTSSQVVTRAELRLSYRLSPQLRDGSRIALVVNGMRGGSVSLVRNHDESGAGEVTLAIPAELLLIDNTLELQYSGACSASCNAATLSTTIEPDSTLELFGRRLRLASDLALLPAPFLDSATQTAVVPFAFIAPPAAKTLQAAGIVAAWFGSAYDYQGVRFSVSVGRIPTDNAVLVATAASLPLELRLTRIEEPTIAVRPNPRDPYSQVLVVTGKDDDQVLVAASALALGTTHERGDTMQVGQFALPDPRKEDDAPRWIASDHTSSFGEVFSSEQLSLNDFGSETLYFRLPPDLYYGNLGSIRLQLNFRADGLAANQRTNLHVNLNTTPVARVSVSSEGTLIQHATVVLPVSALHSFGNVLTFDWRRNDLIESNSKPHLQLMRNSTIDIHGIPHFIDLPRLEHFAEAGYPFTRYADLSQTAFVLAHNSTSDQLGVYLDLMAYFAARTGYPGLRVTVVSPLGMRSLADKDLIVLGGYSDQTLADELRPNLPFSLSGNGPRLLGNDSWWMDLQRSAWNLKGRTRQSIEDLFEADSGSQGLIVGLESPFGEGHSLVAIFARDDAATDLLGSQLVGGRRSGAIYGSICVLYNGRFESLYLARDEYQIGTLPRYQAANRWFIGRTYFLPLVIGGCCFLLTLWIQPWLERKARLRLEGRA
jgi:cellulose synthase (UDP-forming)